MNIFSKDNNILGLEIPSIIKSTPTETKKAITRANSYISREKEIRKKLEKITNIHNTFINKYNVIFDKRQQAKKNKDKKKYSKLKLQMMKLNEVIKKTTSDLKVLNNGLEKIKVFKEQIKEFNNYKKIYDTYENYETDKKVIKSVKIDFLTFVKILKRWKIKEGDIEGKLYNYRPRLLTINFNCSIFNKYLLNNIVINQLYEEDEKTPSHILKNMFSRIYNILNKQLVQDVEDKKPQDPENKIFWALYRANAIKILNITEQEEEEEKEPAIIEYFDDIPFESDLSLICDNKFNEFELDEKTFIKPYYITNDYLKDNYISNSCGLTSLIYVFSKLLFNKGYYKLDYKKVSDLMGLKLNNVSNPIKINHLKNFINNVSLNLKIVIVDCYLNLIEVIRNPKYKDDKWAERTAYFQIYDNHIIPLLHNTNSLEKLLENKTIIKSKLSDYYSHYTYQKNELEKEIFINDLEGFNNFIENINKTDKKIYILYVSSEFELRKILFDMMYKKQFKPSIITDTGNLINIKINCFKNIKINIKSMIDDQEGINILDNIEEIEQNKIINNVNYSKEVEKELYNNVINPKYVSSFNTDTLKFYNQYKINVDVGIYKNIDNNIILFGLDDVKAYSSRFNEIEWIPQIDYFDNWEQFNNIIIDNYFYLVECITDKQDKINNIVFNGLKVCKVMGLLLKLINPKNYNVLYQLRTKKIEISFKEHIKKVYDDEKLTQEQKKFIVNKIIGCLNIQNNKLSKTNIFKTLKEANTHNNILEKQGIKGIISQFKDYSGLNNLCSYEPLYIISQVDKKHTITNYTPIYNLILTLQKIRIIKNIQELERNNVKVLGIKTDCLYIEDKHLNNPIIQNKLRPQIISDHEPNSDHKLYNTLGGYKLELNIKPVEKIFTIKPNELIKINTDDKIIKKTFDDEFNLNDIITFINNNNKVLISAKFAGCGKSYICKQLSKNKDEILFITPTNVLSLEYKKEGYKSKTAHKYLGVNFEKTKQTAPKKDKNIKYIVFDEVYLFDYELLKLIYKRMREEPNIIYLATGDPNQRDAIGSNPKDIIRAINYIFNTQIYLKVIKRQDKSQISRIEGIYTDIFEKNKYSPEYLCKKYNIKTITDTTIHTNKHITYFKNEAELQNDLVLDKLGKDRYDINNYLLVKKTYLTNKIKLYMNYKYKIIKSNKKEITLFDEFEEVEHIFKVEFVNEYFKNDYSQTLDSLQGITIREPFTIHNTTEYNYIDKKFIWTAITRADSLDNVFIKI